MKINIQGSAKSAKARKAISVINTLFADAEVQVKFKFTMPELENSRVIELDSMPDSEYEMAIYIANYLDMGISDSILSKFK